MSNPAKVIPWRIDEVANAIRRRYANRITAACVYLQADIRRSISIPSRTVKLSMTKTGKIKKILGPRGSNRSKPGEPPHKDYGILRSSISIHVDADRLVGLVGTTVKYARWLEFGVMGGRVIEARRAKVLTDGTTFFGRRVTQGRIAPRPFLRPAVKRNRQAILDILEFGRPVNISAGA